jgi:hypothetical protein
MREILSSIEGEWRRYKGLGEAALRQVRDEELGSSTDNTTNSIAILVSHVAGNLKSRFTDFLTSDGEKRGEIAMPSFSRTRPCGRS